MKINGHIHYYFHLSLSITKYFDTTKKIWILLTASSHLLLCLLTNLRIICHRLSGNDSNLQSVIASKWPRVQLNENQIVFN